MKNVIAIFVATLAFSVNASDWVPLAETEDYKWDGRAGSRTHGQTRNGAPVIKASGRIFNKKSTSYSFVQWYVTIADCKAGQGLIVTLDMKGDVRYDNDFVLKGGSIASDLADMLCDPIIEANGRGI